MKGAVKKRLLLENTHVKITLYEKTLLLEYIV